MRKRLGTRPTRPIRSCKPPTATLNDWQNDKGGRGMPAGYLRRCAKCGNDDTTRTFKAPEDIQATEAWACPTCAWTDYEIVAVGEKPAGSQAMGPPPQERQAPAAGAMGARVQGSPMEDEENPQEVAGVVGGTNQTGNRNQ